MSETSAPLGLQPRTGSSMKDVSIRLYSCIHSMRINRAAN